MLTVEDIDQAQELLVDLRDGLEKQQKILVDLMVSLAKYADFIQKQIKIIREGENATD